MDFIFVNSKRKGMEYFGAVYVRVRTKGVNKKYSLGLTIDEGEWQRYKEGDISDSLMKSIGISYITFKELLIQISQCLCEDNLADAKAVIRSVKARVLNGEGLYLPLKSSRDGIQLVDFIYRYADSLANGNRLKFGGTGRVSADYIHGMRVVAKTVEEYQSVRMQKVMLDDVTLEFSHDFARWNRSRGMYPNTINSRIAKIRTVMREAFEKHLTECDDFHRSGFVPKAENVDHIFLTPQQIDELYHYHLTENRMRLCRDAFIIGCLTGQRFSDYVRINTDMMMELEGIHFINLVQKKTGKKVLIPMDKRIQEILARYGGRLPYLTSQELNKKLKLIAEQIGWTHNAQIDASRMGCKRGPRFCDMIGTHTARRSFATNAYANGIPLSSIMAVTGHSSEKNLRRYLKLQPVEKAIIAARDFDGIVLTKDT